MLMRSPGLYACVVRVDQVCDVQRLMRRAARAICAADYTDRQIESMLTHVLTLDVRLVRAGTYFAATDGARVVGVGAWRGGGAGSNGSGASAHVHGIFVEPDHARRGVGRLLLNLCAAAAAEAGFARLEAVSNLTAEPLFRACGFDATEAFDLTLPDGTTIDAIRMAKPLVDRRRYNIPRA
jgi:GNAT superfamily N-acetyltransferase